MNRGWAVVFALVLVVAGGIYWYMDRYAASQVDEPAPPTSVEYETDADTDNEPSKPRYPLGDEGSDEPGDESAQGDADTGADSGSADADADADAEQRKVLPPLEESDQPIRADLRALSADAPFEALLVPDRLIQRFVVFVNSLDGRIAPLRMWPVLHAEGVPEVRPVGDDERYQWQAVNAERYDPYVRAFTAPGAETLTALYLRYYPLIQKAYADLGQEEQYFNDRLIGIIDHLLATPEAQERYRLTRPRVLYEFADPQLEALSSGQKILLRIGPEHSRAVREQLRELRAAIIARTDSGG